MFRIIILAVLTFISVNANAADKLDLSNLKDNVRHKDNAVFIDGLKPLSQKDGYCAPASVAMILEYYGMSLSQKQLARIFDSSHRKGTSPVEMLEEFQQGKLKRLKMTPMYGLSVNKFRELIKAYTLDKSVSKNTRKKLARIGNNDFQEIFKLLDKDIAARIFPPLLHDEELLIANIIRKYIDAGFPLLWCVELSLDPVDRTSGGHMRIINGYIEVNGAISGIIYTDSWGKFATNRRMPLDRAVMETTGIFSIESAEKSK